MSDIAVEIEDVSIVFGDRPNAALPLMDAGKSRSAIQKETSQILGVHDCKLDVYRGEIVVLMGLSGSGKSTLLRAVNGLNPVTRGRVAVHCDDWSCEVGSATPEALRRLRIEGVAMVFQQFALLPWRSVRENVGLGLEFAGLNKSERRAQVDRQLALVGLTEWAERQVGELSGGMQQRVGLARAFATEAPILLMDEPFSALDPLIRTRLQDELLDLQRRLRRTIIFVSHDLDEAFKIGDRIAIMEGGRIVQCGTPQDIFSTPVNKYVADFVAHMNPLGVLRAEDVMAPVSEDIDLLVSADTDIREVIEQVGAATSPIGVERDGRIIGQLTQASVLRRLADPGGGQEEDLAEDRSSHPRGTAKET